MYIASPDTLFQSSFSRDISRLRTDLERSAREMATGRREDILAATRGNSESLLRAQASIDSAEQTNARLVTLDGRYRVASNALRTISELSEDAALAAQSAGDATSGLQSDGFAAVEGESALSTIFSSLEARFGGRAIFGGDLGVGRVMGEVSQLLNEVEALIPIGSSAAAAEAAVQTYFAPGGQFETNIYQGGGRLDDPQLADGATIDALFTADSEALRELYQGLVMTSVNERVDIDERSTFLRRSAEVTQTARETLIAEEARIGLSLNAIEREQGRQADLGLEAEQTIEAILGRDPYEAATETQDLEARLQAAYTVTGRISALRLTNFLR